MSLTLGGNVVIRNGIEMDFCYREAIQSLLPICDVVSVCDGESTDGTQEDIRQWMKYEPKISLCVWPWPNPKADPNYFVEWCNYNRNHLHTTYQFQLDADEVVSEKSYDEILKFKSRPMDARPVTLRMKRWTFWRDHRHLIPIGECLCDMVNRVAPQTLWLASDGYHPKGEQASRISVKCGIEIFHYGFIRKREAFFKKERFLQESWVGSYDPRLEKAEKYEGNWMTMPGVVGDNGKPGWENKLDEFKGDHPKVAHRWLKERGYDV